MVWVGVDGVEPIAVFLTDIKQLNAGLNALTAKADIGLRINCIWIRNHPEP